MINEERIVFTKEMKKDYTILIPTMLPTHFNLIMNVIREYGNKCELLENKGKNVVDSGLRYVHNDTCYPALLVIGQMIDALNSGNYDTHKVAFLISQTGGGCRASNYIHLLRKALKKSGYGYVPVVSLSFANLEKNEGFKLSPNMIHRMFYCVLYGDLMMQLGNQVRPYEIEVGATNKLEKYWTDKLAVKMKGRGILSYKSVLKNYRQIIKDYEAIPYLKQDKVKVGIVGEIYVKFSPLGNNDLEKFLLDEGAEVVMPGLLDFCLYCIYNNIFDKELYGTNFMRSKIYNFVYKFLLKKQDAIIKAIKESGRFRAQAKFDHVRALVESYVGYGTKMGEGWLLTAEMIELIDQDINNIICTQPFGCLPNHIVGKGMMKTLKARNPKANIVAIDYDPSATKINQENRIKLMLASATRYSNAATKEKSDITIEFKKNNEEHVVDETEKEVLIAK